MARPEAVIIFYTRYSSKGYEYDSPYTTYRELSEYVKRKTRSIMPTIIDRLLDCNHKNEAYIIQYMLGLSDETGSNPMPLMITFLQAIQFGLLEVGFEKATQIFSSSTIRTQFARLASFTWSSRHNEFTLTEEYKNDVNTKKTTPIEFLEKCIKVCIANLICMDQYKLDVMAYNMQLSHYNEAQNTLQAITMPCVDNGSDNAASASSSDGDSSADI